MNLGNEVLTLQFGHYSNYIGSHWLNIQEAGFSYNPNFVPEINNDVLFREGQTVSGEVTYTPRLLLVDFQRSLGHLESANEAASLSNLSEHLEGTKLENLSEPVNYERNEYLKDSYSIRNGDLPVLKASYKLDDSVSTWTDYLIPSLHDRSVNVIPGHQFGINHEEFTSFSLGSSMWTDSYFEEDFTDKIRWFMEECDNLQGFQLLIDAHNGFSGLASRSLEYLKDEFEKKTIFTIPTYDLQSVNKNNKKEMLLLYLNSILGMSQFTEFSNLVVPLSLSSHLYKEPLGPRTFKYLNYNYSLKYHTSAILASALESITTPYRLRQCSARMDDILKEVGVHGRVVASMGINIPFPMSGTDKLFNVLDTWDGTWFESLTPNVQLCPDEVAIQLVSTRGISNKNLLDELSCIKDCDTNNPTYQCKSVAEMLKLFFNFTFDCTKTLTSSCDAIFRIPSTFPRIFDERYNLTHDPENIWGRIAELRTMASLHNTTETQNLLKEILSPSRSKLLENLASNSGVDKTDFTENIEKIEVVMSCYNNSSWEL